MSDELWVSMCMIHFKGPSEFASGNAKWLVDNTEVLAQQAVLVNEAVGQRTSYALYGKVLEDGTVDIQGAWHINDEGQVQQGMPSGEGSDPSPEYPVWVQPLPGVNPAYTLNDVVQHNGQLWISIHNGDNVWEPGVFGWEVYNED